MSSTPKISRSLLLPSSTATLIISTNRKTRKITESNMSMSVSTSTCTMATAMPIRTFIQRLTPSRLWPTWSSSATGSTTWPMAWPSEQLSARASPLASLLPLPCCATSCHMRSGTLPCSSRRACRSSRRSATTSSVRY